MIKAYLALGSNLGDRLSLLRQARGLLAAADGVRVLASSGLYQTVPVGGPEGQNPYLNAVLEVETTLSPEALLQLTQRVEKDLGRERRIRWGARTLDIDILFYGDKISKEPDLELPHPRLHLRRFVLLPLADLAPETLHPVENRSVRQMLESLPGEGGEDLITRKW